jgi:hypothetical protein
MTYRDPKPEVQRIEELVVNVKQGEIRLPNFQRPFVWKKKEVLKLLDSIYNSYPIGSILLWYTSERLSSERTIADIELSNDKNFYPTHYVLDGQQRLSTLCGALYWNGRNTDSIWNIAFDLENEEFLHPKDEKRMEFFPLNKLLNTSDFINQCKTFDIHPKRDVFYKRAEKLLRSIKDYKIAVVKIGDMTINEVAPIFERINSTGRKLTIVDLMRAATWKGGFDLNDAINKVQKVSEGKGFINIPDNHILRNISACSGLGINREDIDKLRRKSSEELQLASDKCADAYSVAIDFLRTNFPLPTYDYLPYGLQLTFLVEFFNLNQTPSKEQEEELIKWFWLTGFSRHFGTSNTGQNSRDLNNIRQFAESKIKSIPVEHEILLDRFLFDDFRLNIANSKTFALLLASNRPKSLFSGEEIDLIETMSVVNRYDFHHIFPINLYPELNLNVCLNICLLNTKENIQAANQRPSQLFAYLESKHNNEFINILFSNYLDQNCLDALKNNNIEHFFNSRKEIFKREIERLAGRKTAPNTSNNSLDIDNNESEDSYD